MQSFYAGIGPLIGLAILFFICGTCCYCLCYLVYHYYEDDKTNSSNAPVSAGWEAKHFYDPPPTLLTPPDMGDKGALYSFKVIKNGSISHPDPHAVINPAVLVQYPPGHVLEGLTATNNLSHESRPTSWNSARRSSVTGLMWPSGGTGGGGSGESNRSNTNNNRRGSLLIGNGWIP